MLLFSTLLNINETMAKDDFIRLVIEWNQGSPHANNIIPDIQWNGERNIRYGEDGLWLDIEEYRNRNIIAVRYEKKENDGAIWDTDYVMNFDSMKMSVRLDRSYTADALDVDPTFSTPHFITLLIERGYIKDDGNLPVMRTSTVIDETNVGLLTDIINEQAHYDLPVVYVSKTFRNSNPVNVEYLAGRLKGIAHILVEESDSLNSEIRDKCHDKNEYNGAIGIYYPTKVWEHRKYLYRGFGDYDNNQTEKVIRAVIQYSNVQQLDMLFTWQGVNNALLRDRLDSQRKEKHEVEEAWHRAEEQAASFRDTMNEKERQMHEKAIKDAKDEANALISQFDDQQKEYQTKIEELTREKEDLEYQNQKLKRELDDLDEMPILYMGKEQDLYPGEIKDFVLATLQDTLKGVDPNKRSRRMDVIRDVIQNNDYQRLGEEKAREIKQLLSDYTGMSRKIKQDLQSLGFEITQDGKHYKLKYYGEGRYTITLANTPSNNRSGKNAVQEIIRLVL